MIVLFASKSIIELIIPNPDEIEELKWMTISEIDSDYSINKSDYTSWFGQAFEYFKKSLLYE